MRTLAFERVAELVRYEPETGNFYYTTRRSNACRKDGIAGTNGPRGDRILRMDGKTYLAHRVAFVLMTGKWPSFDVDHIDGNPSNNKWENLRDISHKMNSYNVHKVPSHKKHSNLLGAQWCAQGGFWKTEIMVEGKRFRLGTFDTEAEASAAYMQAKRDMHPGFML